MFQPRSRTPWLDRRDPGRFTLRPRSGGPAGTLPLHPWEGREAPTGPHDHSQRATRSEKGLPRKGGDHPSQEGPRNPWKGSKPAMASRLQGHPMKVEEDHPSHPSEEGRLARAEGSLGRSKEGPIPARLSRRKAEANHRWKVARKHRSLSQEGKLRASWDPPREVRTHPSQEEDPGRNQVDPLRQEAARGKNHRQEAAGSHRTKTAASSYRKKKKGITPSSGSGHPEGRRRAEVHSGPKHRFPGRGSGARKSLKKEASSQDPKAAEDCHPFLGAARSRPEEGRSKEAEATHHPLRLPKEEDLGRSKVEGP
jgi:hypothetical protein